MYQVLIALVIVGTAAVSAAQDAAGSGRTGDPSTPVTTASKAPDELTDAREILKLADQAIKRVKSVSYKGTFQGTGKMAGRTPWVSGKVVLSGKGTQGPQQFRMNVDVRFSDGLASKNLTLGSDGHVNYLIDPSTKTAHIRIGASVMGPRGFAALAIAMPHFSHPNAFLDELSMDLATLVGSATVGGVDCYEIQLQDADDSAEHMWWFSKKDLLPRRRQIILPDAKSTESTIDLTLTELQADPEFDIDPFDFVLPEGYTKTSEPAP